MKKYRWPIISVVVICCIVIYWFCCCLPTTTVILVRHAEKNTTAGNNPSLSSTGQLRAQNLATVLAQANISSVYATQFCRTMQTAEPLATERSLTIQVQTVPNITLNPASCTPSLQVPVTIHTTIANHITELADRVRSQEKGKVILIVGHSDTIPALIAELGVDPSPSISEADYGNLFIVTLRQFSTTKLIKARYGQ